LVLHADIGDRAARRHGLKLFKTVRSQRIDPKRLIMGKEARMNVPGLTQGNWRWRCTEALLDSSAFRWFGELTTSARQSQNQPL
jgi:hypothetical protein